jgi:pimeloyl-ACP methyl ester carboxylesterase
LEQVVLFGYSVGGSMALCAAASMSDRVSAVISESAQAFMEDRTMHGLEVAKQTFSSPDQQDRLRRWHGERTEWILKAWLDVWTSPEFEDWTLAEVLPKVGCPVLTIHGDLDEYGTVAFPKMIADLSGGPATLLIFEGCRHVPHRERLEEVLAAAARFIQEST